MEILKGKRFLKEDGEKLKVYECTYCDEEKIIFSLVKYTRGKYGELKKDGYGEEIVFHDDLLFFKKIEDNSIINHNKLYGNSEKIENQVQNYKQVY